MYHTILLLATSALPTVSEAQAAFRPYKYDPSFDAQQPIAPTDHYQVDWMQLPSTAAVAQTDRFSDPGFSHFRSIHKQLNDFSSDHVVQTRKPSFDNILFGGQLMDVYLGTPRQHFSAAVVLNQASLSFCSNKDFADAQHTFNPNLSSTYQPISPPVRKDCGDGLNRNIQGFLATDKLHIAGFELNVTFVYDDFCSIRLIGPSEYDAVIGFPRRGIARHYGCGGTESLIHLLMDLGALPQPFVSLQFRGDGVDFNGEIEIGSVKPEQLTRMLPVPVSSRSIQLDQDNTWYTDLKGVMINNFLFPLPNHVAVLETAVPWISLPQEIIDYIYSFAVVEDHGIFDFIDCSELHSLPNVTFQMAGRQDSKVNLTITPQDYVYRISNFDRQYCWLPLIDQREFGFGADTLVLGTSFLKAWYTVLDYGALRYTEGNVWFAPSNRAWTDVEFGGPQRSIPQFSPTANGRGRRQAVGPEQN